MLRLEDIEFTVLLSVLHPPYADVVRFKTSRGIT